MLVTRCNMCGKLADDATPHVVDGERIDLCAACEGVAWDDWKHAPTANGATTSDRPPIHGQHAAAIEARRQGEARRGVPSSA